MARRVTLSPQTLPVFFTRNLPGERGSHGFSVYKDVLIQWDEDYDERVCEFIDDLNPRIRRRLISVQEREGNLALLWDESVPSTYAKGNGVDVAGDYWTIEESIVLA